MNARVSDPITSHMAAESIKGTTSPLAMRLLKEFRKRSGTSEDAAYRADLHRTGYWKRVSDLLKSGYIEARLQGGKPMLDFNTSGRKAQIWKITPAGRAALRAYGTSKTRVS